MKIRATGISNTMNNTGSILSSKPCVISVNAVSNPVFNGVDVTGIGWKLLTKKTFSHFSLAGTQANIVNPGNGFPDRYEPVGESYLRLTSNGFSAKVELSGMSDANVDKINSAIDTVVQ